MKIDLIICEIGSTTTTVNAFHDIKTDDPKYLGQGVFKTTVDEDDVSIGVYNAIEDLAKNLNTDKIDYEELFATSSAAGGLKMSVHGLVHDMTVSAANEAALGAGGNLQFVTSGRLRESDADKIKRNEPNIILVAGGVNYGERDTAMHNIEMALKLDMNVPIIYAGNIENQDEVRILFEKAGKEELLHVVDNVFPRIDQLDIMPTKKVIHQVFSKHIIHAKGMSKIHDVVTYDQIIPTPGAVMESTILLAEIIGDLVTLDIGGATTDLHSSTDGDEHTQDMLINPEPKNKRTVEGDLGVYVNKRNIHDRIDEERLLPKLGMTKEEYEKVIDNYLPIPETEEQRKVVREYALYCVQHAIDRHAGAKRDIYTSSGKKQVIIGKDLTLCHNVIGTGGPLTRLVIDGELAGEGIIREALSKRITIDSLMPPKDANIFLDKDYIMASLGIMSHKYKDAAIKLLRKTLSIPDDFVNTNLEED